MKLNTVPLTFGALAMVLGVITDQVSKALIVKNASSLVYGYSVFPGFNLVFYRNEGVTFGLLNNLPWWSLSALAIAVCCWIAVMLVQASSRIEALAYGSIIGGAIGNIIDRIRFRGVTDFLDFYVGSQHWPAFNMADVFVVCGVALLLAAPRLSRNVHA